MIDSFGESFGPSCKFEILPQGVGRSGYRKTGWPRRTRTGAAWSVTCCLAVITRSRNPPFSCRARYSGRYRPACRMSQRGTCSPRLPRNVSIKRPGIGSGIQSIQYIYRFCWSLLALWKTGMAAHCPICRPDSSPACHDRLVMRNESKESCPRCPQTVGKPAILSRTGCRKGLVSGAEFHPLSAISPVVYVVFLGRSAANGAMPTPPCPPAGIPPVKRWK